MKGNDTCYVYVHPDGNDSLFGSATPRHGFKMPTLKQAMNIEPEFITGSNAGDVLVFADITIEIKGA